jgi:RimJ/RimL family protein N-acetyltransferase
VNYYPYNALHRRYAEHMTEVSLSDDTRGIIAIDSMNTPQGVILFDQFTETACTAHIAIGNPIALRGLHIEAFKYAFEQLNKRMIIGVVAANNAKALKLNAHFGFTEIARIKDAYDICVDQVVIQMLREDCKYINQLKKVA